jgi:integrase
MRSDEVMTDEPDKAGKPKASRTAGQIVKRGEKKYLIRIFLGRDETTGKRHYHNKTFRGTQTDAQKWLTMALRRRDMGEPIEDTERSMSAWLDEWLKMKTKTVRPRTFEIYTENVNRHVRPALGKRKLAGIVAGDIQKLYEDLARGGMSANTIGLIHAMLTNCFRQALKLDLIRKSPMLAVEPPRAEKKEMLAMTIEQAQAFLKAADLGPHGCWLAFMLATGCRPGESQALKWADVNWQAGAVTIQRNLVRLKGGIWQFGEPKTSTGRRTIPLSPGMMKRLGDHKRAQNEARLKAGPNWTALDLVFCKQDGEPYAHDYLPTIWKATLKKAGLPETFRSYDARHTAATLLLQDKTSPKVVSERLGHASVNITLDVYGHVLPGMQEEATERLDKLIFG